MQVIGVLNGKGGVGKTTLTACLAVRAIQDRAKVAVLDIDPSSRYSDWYRRRCSPDNPALLGGADRAGDAVAALQLNSPYTYVFLDGTPGSLTVTEDAIAASTIVLIPMRASGLDLAS